MAFARGALALDFGIPKRRQDQRDQNRDDRNHHQQFRQGKGADGVASNKPASL
jgi:hypothetical protein